MSLHSLRLGPMSPIPDALIRVAETLKKGIEAGKTPLEDVCIRLGDDGEPLILVEELDYAWEWGQWMGLPWTTIPNGVSWQGVHNGVMWVLCSIRDEPVDRTDWDAPVQETGTFPAVSA